MIEDACLRATRARSRAGRTRRYCIILISEWSNWTNPIQKCENIKYFKIYVGLYLY